MNYTSKKTLFFRNTLVYFFFLLIVSANASNRVLNSGFEYLWGSGNVLARHWTRSTTTLCYATSGPGVSHSGNAAIYVTSTDTTQVNSWTSEKFAVTPFATYTCSVWVKWANVSNGFVRARFRCYDATGSGNYIGELSLTTTGSSDGNWVHFYGTYSIPSSGRCMDVQLELANANAGAFAYFDDVFVGKPVGITLDNLIINPDFEGLDGTYPAFWRRNTSEPFARWTTGFYRSPTTCVFIKQTTGGADREWYIAEGAKAGFIAIDSNKRYRFGCWLQYINVTAGNVGMRVQWMDYSDNTIAISAIATNGTYTSGWINLDSGVVKPPAGAVSARVRLFNTDTVSLNPYAIVWFDDVYFYETEESENPFRVRILTWNIHGGVGIDTVYDINRIADVIAAENPDIVGLNEIWNLHWPSLDDQVELIRARLQSQLGGTWYSCFGPNVNYILGIRMGNAIISRYPIFSYQNHLIKPQLGSEQRGCLEAQINVSGTIVNVFCTHWAHDTEQERILSADSCLLWMSQVTGWKILLGDLNARPYSSPFRRIQSQYIDTIGLSGFGEINTVSNPNPTVRIDHIFVPQSTTIKEAYVVNYGNATITSDHRPVVATIQGGGYLEVERFLEYSYSSSLHTQ